ncbi:hypothetical protein FJV41_07350 [Myxococcus llanfairpwllgwyngyllgogerychwyrndrobwllllantysiliogogogochensis]|uniref:Lipoprotein n=1 Tax=Myxococcus llanfairpwllgwyngyllgogerychwyrndrobwllllantysiliogogogochensis TaxID=2590453 RepID=A0A540X5X9_9BACT|nr:hypothetical protein [Myxococcus llanfairpwllgwyngyllgogerychwyrndrobwllllantysiliogogogochensis]TQF16629.1 hypothetical protein FJV41_07350 [Myxococcus llanfairpwllgwyngyllgogerychwyrndrobwllllantysiliogogogochensis]
MSGVSSKSWVILVAVGLAGCGAPESSPAVPEEVGQSEQRLLTLVTCPVGSTQVTYSPPLRNLPQDVNITSIGLASNCYSLLGSSVTSATSSVSFVMKGYSCTDLLDIGPVTTLLTWNTGESSTMRLTQTTTAVNGTAIVVTQTGTVLSGKFVGATVVRTVTLLSTDLAACDSPEGLAGISGPMTITLLGLL